MANGDGGGGGEGGGSGSVEWQPIYDRVQAQAEALAADRARLEAASKVQRESWEAARSLQRSVDELQAAARDKDAEIERLRAEAAVSRKKLQADARWRMRWEAAYVDLLLGANQKLAELRDGDMVDSRTCAKDPNSMEVQGCGRLSQNSADQAHVASDLGTELKKLKQAYETLSSKKDKEVSALLSEKELVRNQLDIMQQDYAVLLRDKKGEAAQATEAVQKLQQSVDDLKVLAQKKNDEIGRLRAEAVAAKKKLQTAQKLQQSVDDIEVFAQKKDDEIGRLRAEAVAAEKKLQKMHSLVKEKDYEIQRLKGQHPESIQKRNKDISDTHKKSRSDDPAGTVRGKPESDGLRQTAEDYISVTETLEKDGQDETRQKHGHASSISNSGSDADADEQDERDEDGDEQSGSYEDGDQQSGSGDDDDGQSRSDEHDENEDEDEQSGSDVETKNSSVERPHGYLKRKRAACSQWGARSRLSDRPPSQPPWPLRCNRFVTANGRRRMISTGNWLQYVSDVKVSLANQPDKHEQFDLFLCDFQNSRSLSRAANTMKMVLHGHPDLIRRFNEFLPNKWQIQDVKELRVCPCRWRGRRRAYGRPPPPRELDGAQEAGTSSQEG